MLQSKSEQSGRNFSWKPYSFVSACVSLQAIHKGTEFRMPPKKLELLSDMWKGIVYQFEIFIALNHIEPFAGRSPSIMTIQNNSVVPANPY